MSKEQLDLLHYMNRVKQLEILLEEEKVKNFSLRRLLAKVRFAAMPLLTELQNVKGGIKE